MKNKLITKYYSENKINDSEIITLGDFISEIRNENDFIKLLWYLKFNRNKFSLEKFKLHINNDDSLMNLDLRKINESRSYEEILVSLESNLPHYCLSGYFDNEQKMYIHSGLYVLEFRVVEKNILKERLNEVPGVVTHFLSCSGDSVIAIILGKRESTTIEVNEVSKYHDDNFNEIYKYFIRDLEFFPSKKYSDYSLGILHSFLEDMDFNQNADEFFTD